jgi:outer membrane protein assembly factor BamB
MARENARRAPRFPLRFEAPLREAWSVKASLGSVPVLAAEGRLFLRDATGVFAVDAANRERLWTYPWPARPLELLHQAHLFLVVDHELHVVDIVTGRPRSSLPWSSRGPALAVGHVLLAHGPDHEYGGHQVLAVDWGSGRRLWTQRFPEGIEIEGPLSATEDVFVCEVKDRRGKVPSSAVVCRRLDTGAERWRRPDATLEWYAGIHADCVVGWVGNRLAALRLSDGEAVWESDGGRGYLYGDRYYCQDFSGRYRVIDMGNGKVRASWDLDARLPRSLQGSTPRSVLLVTETQVFLASERNSLLAFTRDTGEYVWSHQPKEASIGGTAACIDGRLYYQNGGNRLYCLEPK